MDAAALHAHVAAVIDREARRFAQVLLEQVLLAVAVDADHLHALVDGVEHQFGAVHFAHGADQFGVVLVLVQVVRRPPAEVAARLDARRDVTKHVADILVVDDRLWAPRGVGLGPVQRGLIGRTGDAHSGNARYRPGPRKVAVDDQVTVATGRLEQVRRWHARVVEHDLRIGREAMAELVNERVRHARRVPLHHDGRQPLGAALSGLRADDHRAGVHALCVPYRTRRPVLAAIEHVHVAIALGDHADPIRTGEWDIEVRGAPRGPGRFAGRPPGKVLAGGV